MFRYHPAIIAQGAATLGLLSDDRFVLGLGAGERLNEHVVGQGWPGLAERHDRFMEALDIIQGLLKGEISNYRGQYLRLDHAKLFDRPQHKPAVIVASGGPEASHIAAHKGDGLIATEPKPELVKAYREAGGKGPCYAEVAMCWAASEEEARKTAHHLFRWSVTGWPVQAELPTVESFASATKSIPPEAVAQMVSCGPSAEKHLQAVDKFIQAGFDHIILNQIGPDQQGFLGFFERELAPALRRKQAAA
jgi:G6PDH family F420-dependent oxidoreductase